MKIEEIDYGKVTQEELKMAILQDAGVDQIFLNSSAGWQALTDMYYNSINDAGVEAIPSAEEAKKIVETIKKDWIIEDGYVMAKNQAEPEDKDSFIFAENRQVVRGTELKKVGDSTIDINKMIYGVEYGMTDETKNLGYEDIPEIMKNGNRIQESVTQETYELNGGDEDTLISNTTKGKYTTVDANKFEEYKTQMETNPLGTMQEVANKSDEYWKNNIVRRAEYNDQVTDYSEFIQEGEIEGRKQYTDEQMSEMASTIFSKALSKEETVDIQWGDTLSELAQKYNTTIEDLSELNGIKNPDMIYAGNKLVISREEQPISRAGIIESTLREMGVSEKLLQDEQCKGIIIRMAEESMSKSEDIKSIETKEGIEQMLQQLNKDLIIKDDYIAGEMPVSEEDNKAVYEMFGKAGNTASKQQFNELFIDEKGLLNFKDIGNIYITDVANNPKNSEMLNMPQCQENNNYIWNYTRDKLYEKDEEGNWKQLTQLYKDKNLTESKEQFGQSGFPNLTIEQAVDAANKPYNEFDNVKSTQLHPDIIVNNILEGKNNQKQTEEKKVEENIPQEQSAETIVAGQEQQEPILNKLLQIYDNADITIDDLTQAAEAIQRLIQEREQATATKEQNEGEIQQ